MFRFLQRDGRGFTLIEAVVTVVLLGIVLGVASVGYQVLFAEGLRVVPRTVVQDVVGAVKQQSVGLGGYVVDARALAMAAQPAVVVEGPSAGVGEVSVEVSEQGQVGVAMLGADGVCVGVVAEPLHSGGKEQSFAQERAECSAAVVLGN